MINIANDLMNSPIFQPPLIYILIFVAVLGIGLILFLKFFKKKDDIHFKGESLEEVLQKQNLKKYFDIFGRKTKGGKLFYTTGKIKISKVVMFKTKLERIKVRNIQKSKDKNYENGEYTTTDIEEREFILFLKGGFLANIPILNLIFKKEYFIIDNLTSFITKDKYDDKWIINGNVHLHLFGGIWVSSSMGTSYLTELIYKKVYENSKEVEFNTPKRFVWYNDKYANNMSNKELDADIEKDKWADKQSRESKG